MVEGVILSGCHTSITANYGVQKKLDYKLLIYGSNQRWLVAGKLAETAVYKEH